MLGSLRAVEIQASVVCRIDRFAVRRARRERASAAKLVRSERSSARGKPLRSLCGVQSRIVCIPNDLPVRCRAAVYAAHTDSGVVRRLFGLDFAHCGGGALRRPRGQTFVRHGRPGHGRCSDDCRAHNVDRVRRDSGGPRDRRHGCDLDRLGGCAIPLGSAIVALSSDLCGDLPRPCVGGARACLEFGAVRRGGPDRRHVIFNSAIFRRPAGGAPRGFRGTGTCLSWRTLSSPAGASAADGVLFVDLIRRGDRRHPAAPSRRRITISAGRSATRSQRPVRRRAGLLESRRLGSAPAVLLAIDKRAKRGRFSSSIRMWSASHAIRRCSGSCRHADRICASCWEMHG